MSRWNDLIPQTALAVEQESSLAEAPSPELALARAEQSARAAADALERLRIDGDYWYGDLTADSTLECDFILLELWLYPPDEHGVWNPPSRARIDKAIRAIWERQQPDGGWRIYNPGPSEINATARAYTVLKLCGADVNDPRMKRARELVIAMGGLQACNSYTKINLSFFDLFPAEFAPTVPPEIVSLPGSILYQMSSWTRTIIVPLSIVQALGGTRPTPNGVRVEELFHPKKKLAMPRKDKVSLAFIQADKLVKKWSRKGPQVIRKAAIRKAEEWMLQRLLFTEGLGAIYPSMMYAIMAMDSLGYERDHPDMASEMRHFYNLLLEDEDKLIFQPAKSPVWDTAIAAYALGELGRANPVDLAPTADWLINKQIRRRGDWSAKRPDLTPGGWAFEFDNEFYPDIDDTAMVLLSLLHAQSPDADKQRRAEQRAIDWLFGMQSSDGGFAAFDVDNNWQILNKVPFADHNAMLDPTCPDITGRVLESLCRRGFDHTDERIARAIDYLLREQLDNGAWFGRWGVIYTYGTFLAMRGLKASGAKTREVEQAIARGAEFLRGVQNRDGGWGESCRGYDEHKFVAADSTPSQTAWGLLGLLAEGDAQSESVRRAVAWLTAHQHEDGTWEEEITTGTGFPSVFYISYHLYPTYFPALALATYKKMNEE